MSIAISDGSLQINGIRPEGENQLTRQLFQDYTNDVFKEPRKEKKKDGCENGDENEEQSIASTSNRSVIESNGLHYTIHQVSTDIQRPSELVLSESSPKNDQNDDSDDAQTFSSLDFMLLNNNLNELLQQQLNQELQRDTSSPNSVNICASPSPWMRNAGRKKSHPVWNFFRDLKGVEGTTGGVMCLHCEWTGDDRSPNNLRTHLKRCHMIDGIYQRFSAKLAVTPTQPYVKRARAGTRTSGATTPMTPQPLATGAEQATDLAKKPFSLLESIPKINEVLNISAGFTATTQENESVEQVLETHEVPCVPSGSQGDDSPIQADDCSSSEGIPSANSPPNISVNPLSSLLCSVAANPLAYMTAMQALVGQSSLLQQYQLRTAASAVCENIALSTPIGPASSPSSAFTLNEGSCVTQLMKMAIDLDLTMSYHRRRGDVEMCFESNRTAEKSGARGKVLCLTDCGREIRVTERTNGNVTESELWTKTDFSQFHWAIRGRCQKLLLR